MDEKQYAKMERVPEFAGDTILAEGAMANEGARRGRWEKGFSRVRCPGSAERGPVYGLFHAPSERRVGGAQREMEDL